jgi:hypothetical protein
MACASDETKQLLVRMNRLQSQLMRDESSSGQKAIAVVGRKLDEIEQELSRLNVDNLDDSAVFMEDEDKSEPVVAVPIAPAETSAPAVTSTPSTPSRKSSSSDRMHRSMPSFNDSVMESTEKLAYEQIKSERDNLATRLQGLSQGLATVQSELRQRYDEVRELNNLHNEEREKFEEQVERLQSENEQLRSDLGFEYSEMLFLKLQMKSIEVDVDNIADKEPEGPAVTVEDVRKARAKRVKKNRILSEMDCWRTDWQDVNARFKRRRRRCAVPTSPLEPAESEDVGVELRLEVVRGASGRTTSLTIKRIEGAAVEQPAVLTEEVEAVETVPVEVSIKTPASYVDHDAQTDLTAEDFNFDDLELEVDEHYCANPAHAGYEISVGSQVAREDDESDEEAGFSEEELEAFEEDEEADEEEDEEDQEEDIEDLTGAPGFDIQNFHPQTEPTGAAHPPHMHFETPSSNSSRSAWQELWASLASLSGLPDDEEDDF